MMGTVLKPSGPMLFLCIAYLIATYRAPLVPPMQRAAMQILPERSLSVTLKNLEPMFLVSDLNVPVRSTSLYLFIMLTLGIRTLLNLRMALSTPLTPNLIPMSRISTPGSCLPATVSLIGTRKALTPSFFPLTIVYPKTRAWSAWL